MLGECTLDLAHLIGQLTDVYGVGVRQNLSFFRSKDNKHTDIVVGKFSVLLKIVADYMNATISSFDGKNLTGPRKTNSQIHPLPVEEPNFRWRLRVDLR